VIREEAPAFRCSAEQASPGRRGHPRRSWCFYIRACCAPTPPHRPRPGDNAAELLPSRAFHGPLPVPAPFRLLLRPRLPRLRTSPGVILVQDPRRALPLGHLRIFSDQLVVEVPIELTASSGSSSSMRFSGTSSTRSWPPGIGSASARIRSVPLSSWRGGRRPTAILAARKPFAPARIGERSGHLKRRRRRRSASASGGRDGRPTSRSCGGAG